MKQRRYTLAVLAAGIGSRFGGIKQLHGVGPSGEIIMDYAIYDAIEAGFDHIVFILRREIEADFHRIIGARLKPICIKQQVQVECVFQDTLEPMPGFHAPEGRKKPWGTVQALLACREKIDGPFVIVNADDYYGKAAFRLLRDFLEKLPEESRGTYCMAGFRLGSTLSDYGAVTRGLCEVDAANRLQKLREARGIVKTPEGAMEQGPDGSCPLDADQCVSMNMWGFTPDVFPAMEALFRQFLAREGGGLQTEYVLPDAVEALLEQQACTVEVLPTPDAWFGMTYQEDVPYVRKSFRALADAGVYNQELYQDMR